MTTIRTTQLSVSADMINFRIGQPGISLLPTEWLERAATHRLARRDPAILQYGLEQGDGYFRLALADFLTDGYGLPVTAENLFITNGASQGLDLLCTLFTKPGDVIFVEEPTYFLALRIFADHHLRVIGLPTDEQGLIVEAVEEKLAEHHPVFLYTIPTFQNPAGFTTPLSRRERLVTLSQEHEFFIVADEVYHLLNYTSDPPLPMASYLETGTLFSLGSFSKILAPGLRLGWIQAAPPLLNRLAGCGLLDSGGGLNPFTSGIVRSMLEQGWQNQHLAHLKEAYTERAAVLAGALRQTFSEDVTFTDPEGGFFIWLSLPPEVDTSQLLTTADQNNVSFLPGTKFSSRGGLRNKIRLSFAFYDGPDLEQGVARLEQSIKQHLR